MRKLVRIQWFVIGFLILICWILGIGFARASFQNSKSTDYKIYESENGYLVLGFEDEEGKIHFRRAEKDGRCFESSWADIVSENVAVLDGTQMLPSTTEWYYEFVFFDNVQNEECVELYNKGKLIERYTLILEH